MRALRRIARLAGGLAFGLCCAGGARAEPAPVEEYRNVSLGPVLDFGFASSVVGQGLLGDLGGQYVGIQTFLARRLVVQWDALLAARGGLLGNTLPYTWLAGARTLATAEVGYRFHAARSLSLYAGGRLGGELAVVTRPGTPIGELDRLNDMAGVGGVVAHGLLRVDVGVSLLRGPHSLLAVAFFQEAARAPWGFTPGLALAEGGVALRYDLRRRLTAQLEALGGGAAPTTIDALGTTDRATYAEVNGLVRGIFGNGMWLAVSGGYARQLDRRTYAMSGRVYDTASAPAFNVGLTYGVEVRPRRYR